MKLGGDFSPPLSKERRVMGFEIVTTIQKIGNFINDLQKVDEIGLDIEASSLDTHTAKLYLLQLALGETTYVFDCLKFERLDYILDLIKGKKLIGHNIKYDVKVLYQNVGVWLTNLYDTMLGEVLIHQGIGEKYISLDALVEQYFGVKLDKTIRESFYSNGELKEFTQEQYIYSALDVKYLAEIKRLQIKQLEESKQIPVTELEMKLLPVVIKMEYRGVLLDVEHWKRLMVEAQAKADELNKKIIQSVLGRLNVKQYPSLLYAVDVLRIPVKTKKARKSLEEITCPDFYGDFLASNINISSNVQLLTILNLLGIHIKSTGEKILKEYKPKDPILDDILEYREYCKKASSFGDSFIEKIHPATGRIHADFGQLNTDSGRFAPAKPNVNQIVRDSEYRDCFIAPEEYVVITSDYSQQELRLAGSITGEPKFIDAYVRDIDLHTLTASLVYKVPFEKVEKSQRQIAKGVNFAILYGSSEKGLAYAFSMPLCEAEVLHKSFYDAYPVLGKVKTCLENEIVKRKYSSTLLGRRRYFEDRKTFSDSGDYEKYISSMRKAGFNHIIQGSGADITKQALVYLDELCPFKEDDFYPVLVVHDEIVVYAKKEIQEEAKKFLIDCMLKAEQPYLGPIPAAVDAHIDVHWAK